MRKRSRRLTMALLGLILLLGFALRVYQLGAAGIWGDEAFSISMAQKPVAAILAVGADLHPPLYHALLHFWLKLAGGGELGARFPSAVAGVLLIPAVYVTGRRLVGRPAGLIAALLAAVSPLGVLYSQEARMYAQAALFCTLSTYFAARLWAATSRFPEPSMRKIAPLAAGYFLATLAALYSHFYALFVIAAQDLYVLWLYRRRLAWLGRWAAEQVALGLVLLVWLGPQIVWLTRRAGSRAGALGLEMLWQIVSQSFTAFSLGWPALPWLSMALILFAAILAAGLIALAVSRSRAADRSFMALYLFLPLILAWLVGPLMQYFHPRHLLVALPAFLIVLAAGVAALGIGRRAPGWKALPGGTGPLSSPGSARRSIPPAQSASTGLPGWFIAALALAGLVTVSGVALAHVYTDPIYAKSGYREMMAAIERQAKPGDAIFLLNPEQTALFDYYGDRSLPRLVFPLPGGIDDARSQAKLAKITREDKRIWLVMFGNARDWDPGGGLQAWLSGHAFRAWRDAQIDTQVELYVIGQVEPEPITPVDFGGLIRLEGYGLSARTLAPGDTLQIALGWAAVAKMDRDYTIFTHLIDAQGKVVGQFDGPPMGGAHPTSAWAPGEKVVDRFGIQLDPATPPGIYQLEVGWYDLATLARIPVVDAQGNKFDDRALLVQITIEP